ncbi:MAG: hypothetical protein H0W88_09975 [Parachlamydiaceae bacterium]|nr:hypothetical protein [Parachlamydiaceae bacterium]
MQKFRLALLATSLIIFNLSGNESLDGPMEINSGEAIYNGQDISLEGNVVIQHGLGKISTHRLSIFSDKEKKMKFSFVSMNDGVSIELQSGGHLECQKAQIDYLNLHATFLGDENHPDVIYQDEQYQKDKSSKSTPLVLKSHQIKADLIRQYDPKRKSQKTLIREIRSDGNVRAYYNNDYLIFSDFATYRCSFDNNGIAKNYLTMDVSDPEKNFCVVTNKNGDRIQAPKIDLDTFTKILTFTSPQGTILIQKEGKIPQQIQFTSDALSWNEEEKMLTMQKNIDVQMGDMGDIKTPNELRLYQNETNGKNTVRSIWAKNETELTYKDKNKNFVHKVYCHGPMMIDHEHLTVVMESPKAENGEVPEGKQVYFEDLLGDIYSDSVVLNYSLQEKTLVPSKLLMQGNVKMLNRFDGHIQESSSVLQYALADSVEYDPKNSVMILKGLNGNRVLFYDKVNNLQMSAPALTISRDEKSKRESIKGSGDVRFTFIEHEIDQLRQHFQLKESP